MTPFGFFDEDDGHVFIRYEGPRLKDVLLQYDVDTNVMLNDIPFDMQKEMMNVSTDHWHDMQKLMSRVVKRMYLKVIDGKPWLMIEHHITEGYTMEMD